jgi:RNA polymerase sigma-70 factor (ECF subfamily)
MTTSAPSGEELQRERAYLLGIAYRMLGSASDAEDVVQEALLRASSASDLRSVRAFLTTVVTRLCLDELGSARRRRESYVGPNLPEPVQTDALDTDQRETVSLALLIVLDELSPLERAVFVLRDVFDLEFSEIAEALERSEAACRKLLQRAREHIAGADRAKPLAAETQLPVAHAFFQALATGDLQALVEVLASDATMRTDHGGKVSAARRTLEGGAVVAKFMSGIVAKGARVAPDHRVLPRYMNGAPGVVVLRPDGSIEVVFTLQIGERAGKACVTGISAMRNPDKLSALQRAVERGETLHV